MRIAFAGNPNSGNICHASDSAESAEVEIKRFFKPEEIFDNVD